MPFPVLCPDGVDRLKARWDEHEDAVKDARYFSPRTFGCCDWSGDWSCPGGPHYVPNPEPEPELALAWSLDGPRPEDEFQ